jgi:hypothetical protein
LECFHKRDSERLGAGIGLAVDVGGGQESRHISSLTQKPHAISDVQLVGPLLQFVQISSFRRPLRSAHKPGRPSGYLTQFPKSLQMKEVALPSF